LVLRIVKRIVLLLVLLAVPAAHSARLGGQPVALVTAETQNQLIAVELPSGRILRRLAMPADPQNVVTNATYALVVSARAGAVTIVGTRRLHVLKVLRGFSSPHIALFVPDRELAYVTDDARGELAVIDLAHRRVTRRVFVGVGAHHMTMSPDATRLWIALGERARSITVLDTTFQGAPRVIGHVDPGGEAHDLVFSPAGTRVWVTYDDRASIAIFDAQSRRRVRVIRAGSPPQHLAFDRFSNARHAYLTSGNDGTLRIVSLRNGQTLRMVAIPRGSFNVSTGGSLVVTSSLTNGTLTEMDENGRVLLRKRVAPAARDVAVAVLP
jgi:DNA-binding beta-propeller fold protein YncE